MNGVNSNNKSRWDSCKFCSSAFDVLGDPDRNHIGISQTKLSENNIPQILRNAGTVEVLVKCIKKIHIFLLNLKVKNPCIGSNAVRMNGFRNNGDSLLDGPAKTDLCRSMCILCAKDAENIIIQISTTCQKIGRASCRERV